MEDVPVNAPREAWLDEYRRERLARLERENDWLRGELSKVLRALAEYVVDDTARRRSEPLVRLLRETAP